MEREGFVQLVEALPVAVFVLDRDGHPTYANDAARRLLGRGLVAEVSPGDLFSTYRAYLAGTDRLYPMERAPIVRALAGHRARVDDMEIRRPDGHVVAIEVTAAPIFDVHGNVAYAVAVFQDVTRRRQSEESLRKAHQELGERVDARTAELAASNERLLREIAEKLRAEGELMRAKEAAESANRAKTMFLGSMSHELRTPLNHMIGYAEMLREAATEKGVPELVPDLDRILEATRHLSAIISDILDLSKMETEEVSLTLEEVDLQGLVAEVVEKVRPLAERHGNAVSADVAGLGSIRADLPKVRLALLRPLTNACRFTDHGRITVVGRRGTVDGREAVELTITDTGGGMTGEQLARLFQGFHQPDASPMRVPGGTGLGLAIARRYCEAMDGTLVVTSETGRGTVVTITLPAVVEATSAGS